MSDDGAMISISGLAQAASGPQAAGQIKPSFRALAPIAAGSAPATAAIEPSRPSSPSTVKPSKRVVRHRADRRHQAERDRQIVVAAFLRQIGGREIDGDAARRQREAGGDQRGAHALPGFGHGFVRQADNVEGGQARARPAPARPPRGLRCPRTPPSKRAGPWVPSAARKGSRSNCGKQEHLQNKPTRLQCLSGFEATTPRRVRLK